MAIATDMPGLEVTIEVDGIALPEYDHAPADDRDIATTAIRYVEAPSATDFAIRYLYRPPFTPPSAVQMDIMLDTATFKLRTLNGGGKEECEGYPCSKSTSSVGGQDFTQGFRFAELRTEETNAPVTKELQDRLLPMGRIVLYFYFIEHLEAVKPAEVSQLINSDLGILSEKALHKVVTTPGDKLSHHTSLAAPEEHASVTYNQVKTTENEPFATFTFYYRSTDALKSIGVIPGTPSPSPEPEAEAEDKDPETMTAEEFREELRRMRDKRQDAVRVKRERQQEREDSEVTLADDDEVEWIGTQPAEPCARRVRRGPSVGDEVVGLDD